MKGLLFIFLLILGLFYIPCYAQITVLTPLSEIRVSPDIDATLFGGDGSFQFRAADEQVFSINPDNTDSSLSFNALPNSVANEARRIDLDGYNHFGGFLGFSIDVAAELGGFPILPADVFILFSDGTIGMIFDSAAAGIPNGVNVDAVSNAPGTNNVILSFDRTIELDGVAYQPNDLVMFDGTDFSLFFDGQSLLSNVNIDAASVLDNGHILISLDIDSPIPGFSSGRFTDDDIIEIIPASGAEDDLFFNTLRLSELDQSWVAADLNALSVVPAIQGGIIRFDSTLGIIEVFENAGTVSFGITRELALEGEAGANWSTAEGTATAADFMPASAIASFGEGVNSTINFTITLIDDAIAESAVETFTINIDSLFGDADLGTPSTITVRILDDETILFRDGFEG